MANARSKEDTESVSPSRPHTASLLERDTDSITREAFHSMDQTGKGSDPQYNVAVHVETPFMVTSSAVISAAPSPSMTAIMQPLPLLTMPATEASSVVSPSTPPSLSPSSPSTASATASSPSLVPFLSPLPSSPLSFSSLSCSHSHSVPILPSTLHSLTSSLLLAITPHSSFPESIVATSLPSNVNNGIDTLAASSKTTSVPDNSTEDNNTSALPPSTKILPQNSHIASIAYSRPGLQPVEQLRQQQGEQDKQQPLFLHQFSTLVSTIYSDSILTPANNSGHQKRYQEQEQRLLSIADIPNLTLVNRRHSAFLGLDPSFLFILRPSFIVSERTTTKDQHQLGLHPANPIFSLFDNIFGHFSCSCAYSYCNLSVFLGKILISPLYSWSLQSLFVLYSLPLLVCLTPRLALPLSIYQILSAIATSSSFSSPYSSLSVSSSTDKLSAHSSLSTSLNTYTNTDIKLSSSPASSFFYSIFSSLSFPSTTTALHQPARNNNIESNHNQEAVNQAQMSSSYTSSSGSSSSGTRYVFSPVLSPPRRAPWNSNSASTSSSSSTPITAEAQREHVPSHPEHFNQNAFVSSTTPQHAQSHQILSRQQSPISDQEYDNNHEHGYEHPEYDHEHEYGSDDESEGDAIPNEMEYYLQRCSICFDSRLDFCLELCRDQFCRDCFQKYVKEVVSNSWGLNVTKIKCPVCQDPLPLTEWSKYVDLATLTQYQQYNQPYRSFSRFCNDCEHEVIISHVKQSIIGASPRDLLPMFDRLMDQLKDLLLLSGLNPKASSSNLSTSKVFASMDGRKRLKSASQERSKRDVRAQEIVQQFLKNYQSFCGPPPSSSSSFPSMAQSYFSNLAMRALGSGIATTTPPPLTSSQQPNNKITQTRIYGTAPGSQSIDFQRHFDERLQHLQQDSSVRSSSSIFQRKHHPIKLTGVLEIYKDVMVALIELFDLKAPDQNNNAQTVPRATKERTVEDSSPSVIVAAVVSPCEESITNVTTTQKRALPDRSRMVTRGETKRKLEVKKALVRFSKELLSLEVRPEQWKELQFLHVRWCRWDWCNNCDKELCLQCGVANHHESATCFDHMRAIITTSTLSSRQDKSSKINGTTINSIGSKGKERSDLDTGTLQWKLANTNPCPNCCILIHRDDGCNKVDCMLCGYRFCWICREAWDVGCGFFRCRLAVEDPSKEKDSGGQWEKHIDDWSDQNNDQIMDADQFETLDIATRGLSHASFAQSGMETMHHDLRRRRSEDLSVAISVKPEIGVPNVYMIQAKHARA